MAVNYVHSWSAPSGTITTEMAAASTDGAATTPSSSPTPAPPTSVVGDWSGYNKTLTSERYSSLSQINTTNVAKLKVLCIYDTHQYTSFETGPIVVNDALIGTTEHDIFSLDPANCHENWRTHEDYQPASLLAVNRGAAYMDGLLFRGTEDGRYWRMTSRPAPEFGKRVSLTRKSASRRLRRQSPGTVSSSSEMRAEIIRA